MFLAVLLSTVLLLTSAAKQQPVVTLRQGAVRGRYDTAAEGRQYAAFRGIPYAQPPLGDLRFRPPREHQGWSGVRDATERGSKCTQYNIVDLNSSNWTGSEDCLFLNVYTPRLPSDHPVSSLGAAAGLPVMVWIHGGGFFSGAGDEDIYGVDYLMQEDVVMVTLNYRLSIFGFLSTGDAAAPGNNGMLDQVMALRWVRDNIAEFGGNPQLVTVFGESAGGASVSLHVLSPHSRGLFHRAISQSGAAAVPWGLAKESQLWLVTHYAEQLHCPTDTSTAAVDCLRHAPLEEIMRVQEPLRFTLDEKSAFFKPCVDSAASSPFLPEHPFTLLSKGQFNRVPWMTGLVQAEGGFVYLLDSMQNDEFPANVISGGDKIWSSPTLIKGARFRDEDPSKSGRQLKEFFQRSGKLTPEHLSPLIDMLGDWYFNLDSMMEAELASRFVPVYNYLMDHEGAGRMTLAELIGASGWPDVGVSHADELPYLFRGQPQQLAKPSSPEYQMIRLFVSLWTSFARLGYPTSEVFSMPDWPVYNAVSPAYVRLNSEPSVSSGLFQDRVQFWKSVLVDEWWKPPQHSKIPHTEL